MSRSKYVYIIIDPETAVPVSGFTVKYEMVWFWKSLKEKYRNKYKIYRNYGGFNPSPTMVDITDEIIKLEKE